MERKAVGKGYKKAGAPFGMFGGLMNKKMHARAHDKMGIDSDKTSQSTTTTNKNNTAQPVEPKPGKTVDNKKEE
jgi:hypothetical protein